MSNRAQAVNNYLTAFEILEKRNNEQEKRLLSVRKKAIQGFAELGFPDKKNETWRFTDLSRLIEEPFAPGNPVEASPGLKARIEEYLFPLWEGAQLVFVNGFFMPAFSQVPPPAAEIKISTLFSSDSGVRADFFTEETPPRAEHAFSLLNTALSRDGVSIHIKKNTDAPPVHILSVQTAQSDSSFSMIKNNIHLESGSALKLVETFVALEDSVYFTNTNTTIQLDENSRCDYYKMQKESRRANHISTLNAIQGRDSVFRCYTLDFGGGLVRNNLTAVLNEPGAETVMDGLYLGRGDQHLDNHTVIEHTAPHCVSSELYQGILTDRSRGVFSGMIHVHPDAQKTDARQSNNCLLLSDEAKIDTKPQLEIYADDVQCSHGATVGQLNEEAIFYLRSRGIGEETARHILTYAFAEKIIERIEIPELKERAEAVFRNKLGEELKMR